MSKTKTSGKAVLLGKHHDITGFASADATRLAIQGVHYDAKAKRLEATDGSIAVRIPVCEKAEEFPPVTAPSGEAVSCVIRPETLKKGLANIPKGSSLPVLSYARLSTASAPGESSVKATITATDLDTEQAVSGKEIDCSFPNIENVWPTAPAAFAICLDANQLKKIAEYCVKYGKEAANNSNNRTHTPIRLEFESELKPMRFSCVLDDALGEAPRMEGILMPVRMS